ncbi:MAG: aminotransferase class III-fold pyridoxal phosphate-dependent enzyme [Gammaproteobacteria bacterium]|nr:aminotransferase class III-fold pyridoxal phosphate-dependent enzyme [Gammaproteobacteria bacterium]MDH5310658.1 aminotransferase class III-fold pyridoxal phosphate-dependent enzyme [Gammaproteobacteria bacterium]
MRCLKKSNRHFAKAKARLPLGVSSNFRYWGDEQTIYIKKARGARLEDIDGNRYIDYRLAYGPVILGYADPRVDEAARRGMEVGGVFALSTELEYEVASRICKMVPAAELVRFSNSGTEAVMAALRIARSYSGRDGHVVLEGGYHGVFSEVMWYSEVEDWDPDDGDPEVLPFGQGIPKVTRKLFHTAPLNDADAIEDLFKRHGHRIGSMLIEPIMGNCCGIAADPQYVRDIRALCDRYEIVLIVDEVKTGFRVAKGGAQELYGIQADLCTFAKAMGNGYPIAVVAGREHIMNHVGDKVVHGGTFTGHSVSLAAANTTLQILDETDALQTIENYGLALQQGIGKILSDRGIAHSFAGHPSMLGLFFSEDTPTDYRAWVDSDYEFYDALAPELHDLGILVEPDSREPWFICEAHDMECLGETLDKFELAVDITIDKLPAMQRRASRA